jgi:hypothetical protein
MSVVPETVGRAEAYCRRKGLALADRLGFGVHGSVFAAENQSDGKLPAVKAHDRERFYFSTAPENKMSVAERIRGSRK